MCQAYADVAVHRHRVPDEDVTTLRRAHMALPHLVSEVASRVHRLDVPSCVTALRAATADPDTAGALPSAVAERLLSPVLSSHYNPKSVAVVLQCALRGDNLVLAQHAVRILRDADFFQPGRQFHEICAAIVAALGKMLRPLQEPTLLLAEEVLQVAGRVVDSVRGKVQMHEASLMVCGAADIVGAKVFAKGGGVAVAGVHRLCLPGCVEVKWRGNDPVDVARYVSALARLQTYDASVLATIQLYAANKARSGEMGHSELARLVHGFTSLDCPPPAAFISIALKRQNIVQCNATDLAMLVSALRELQYSKATFLQEVCRKLLQECRALCAQTEAKEATMATAAPEETAATATTTSAVTAIDTEARKTTFFRSEEDLFALDSDEEPSKEEKAAPSSDTPPPPLPHTTPSLAQGSDTLHAVVESCYAQITAAREHSLAVAQDNSDVTLTFVRPARPAPQPPRPPPFNRDAARTATHLPALLPKILWDLHQVLVDMSRSNVVVPEANTALYTALLDAALHATHGYTNVHSDTARKLAKIYADVPDLQQHAMYAQFTELLEGHFYSMLADSPLPLPVLGFYVSLERLGCAPDVRQRLHEVVERYLAESEPGSVDVTQLVRGAHSAGVVSRGLLEAALPHFAAPDQLVEEWHVPTVMRAFHSMSLLSQLEEVAGSSKWLASPTAQACRPLLRQEDAKLMFCRKA